MRRLIGLAALLCIGLPQAATIEGTVVDTDSGEPLADTRVSLQATSFTTTTDAAGHFELNVPDPANGIVVAARRGYYYASTTLTARAGQLTLAMEPVPQANDPDYTLWSPQQCGACHPRQYDEWTDTPMARAGFNTWVHDLYSGTGTDGGMGGFVYLRDSVHADDNPESECASCHQPQGWIESPFSALDDGLSNPAPGVIHGVSCEVCHKVADVDVDKINYPGIFPGAVTFTRPVNQQVQYGVLGDVSFDMPGAMQASYQPGLVAEVCGTCHQDKNDPQGTHEFNGVTSEPTYIEWADSAYADPQSPHFATCVDCHMPVAADNEVCSVVFPTPPRNPERVRSHRIVGTTPQYLQNAVDMHVDTRVTGDELKVTVALANNGTGHHVPTGVTIRNMILLVQAWPAGASPIDDALQFTGSQTVHALGGSGDPRHGNYAELPGKLFAKVTHDADGEGPVFFTEAAGITFDNRIPALATDQSEYSFRLPRHNREIRVRARLIYRRAFRALVEAKGWAEDGHGNPLADMQPPYYGELMEQYETALAAPAQPVSIPLLPGPWLLALVLLLPGIAVPFLPARSRP